MPRAILNSMMYWWQFDPRYKRIEITNRRSLFKYLSQLRGWNLVAEVVLGTLVSVGTIVGLLYILSLVV